MNTNLAISDLMQTMAKEGVPLAALAEVEASLVVLLSKARKLRNAETALVLLGAQLAAEREGCHRATVYRRAIKSRKLAQTATA